MKEILLDRDGNSKPLLDLNKAQMFRNKVETLKIEILKLIFLLLWRSKDLKEHTFIFSDIKLEKNQSYATHTS